MHLGEAEGQRGLLDIAQHGAEESFVLLLAPAQAGLRDRVAERLGRRQLRGLASEYGLYLAMQDLHGGVIADHVMQQFDQQPAALLVAGGGEAQQRGLAQVDAMLARVEAPGQLLGDRPVGGVQAQLGERERRVAPHHLCRTGQALPDEGRAQHVVASHHLLHGIEVAIQMLARSEGRLLDHQVGVAAGGQQMVEENAVLQRGQRVDILDGAHAAGHLLDQMVDLGLGEADERQQLGRDRASVGRDPVGRDLDLPGPVAALLIQALGQYAQHGRLEQIPNRQFQALLAELDDHSHGHQREAAQHEEAVVTADAFDAEQLGPDRGERAFGLPLGGLVGPGRGRGLLQRQRAAVEFAVVGQRQGVEPHEGGRHHVVGQPGGELLAQHVDQLLVGLGHHVGDQARVRGFVAHQHHGFADSGMREQMRLDPCRLDANTANCELLIEAAEEYEIAVGQVAGEIAAAVHAGVDAAGERIVEETLGAEFGAVQVGARDAVAAHIQFAHGTQRHGLAMRVEQVELAARDGTPDRVAAPSRVPRLEGVMRRVHGGLGGTVHVDQPGQGLVVLGMPARQDGGVERVPAEEHVAQAVA